MRYHETHKWELPELIHLATRVEAVPSRSSGRAYRTRLASSADLGELTMHMQKEELILFPAMAKGRSPWLANPIAAMIAERRR